MSFIKKIFGGKDEPIQSYADFWNWFQANQKKFYNVVKRAEHIERDFFNKLSPKLNELHGGIFYLTGMLNEDTAELILTADGVVKNIVFVEELVASAPEIANWKFTALKPALEIKDVSIDMAGFRFNSETMSFHANEHPDYPDEIDITLVHSEFTEENKATITNGVYIFLDNYLGELDCVTTIDSIAVTGPTDAGKDLIPIEKLKSFLIWRQKEFVEKYVGTRHNTGADHYAVMEGQIDDGGKLLAVINTDLLQWDGKASHPWITNVQIRYEPENGGMPGTETYVLLDEIEMKILQQLSDADGYLNVGRQTAESVREIYFACREFRKPSRVLDELMRTYRGRIDIDYDIYIDKYWRSFDRFRMAR